MNEYDEGRIWYRRKGKTITLGITEKAFEDIGDVEGVNLPTEGDELNQDDVIGDIEGTKNTFEIISPVDGVVCAVNEGLSDDFESLVNDSLDEGWICQIKMTASDDEGDSDEEESE